MKPFYIHIGAFKTGTSALQVYFAQNQTALASQAINYLKMGSLVNARSGKISSGNAAFLARTLLPPSHHLHIDTGLKPLLKTTLDLAEKSPDSMPLLSSEFFCDVTIKKMGYFTGILKNKGYQPQFIFFAREQVSYLESMYIQRVKRKHLTATPREFVMDNFQSTLHIHYNKYLNSLADLVGKENVHVRLFGENDIFDDINEILLIDGKRMVRPPRDINVSLNPVQVAIMREMNILEPRQRFADQLVENEALFNQGKQEEKFTVIDAETRQLIEEYFAEDNKNFFKNWFDKTTAFKYKQRQYIDLDEALKNVNPRDLITMFGGLLVRHEDRIVRIEKTLAKMSQRKKRITQKRVTQ